ncbi:MAG: hypothetical protein JWO45_92 [Spartobacteria bacterium]|nr:hypothetical protein [Spartobacteria bacterium]
MIPAFLIVFLAVAYRVATGFFIYSGAPWLSNFAPLAAIALCGGAYFPGKFKFSIPLLALFLSDVILNYHYGAGLFTPLIACRYLTLAVIAWVGMRLQNRASLKTLLPASITVSIFFYVVTNTFAWLSDPGYIRNFSGLIQALTVGLPQYSLTPSWMFFRNSLVSDFLFTLFFVLCMNFARHSEQPRARPALARSA